METTPSQTGWQQTFIYDRFGNRTFDTANGNTTTLAAGCAVNICNPTANVANNRLNGASYDNAGNTTQDASGSSFVYDAESKQIQVSNSSGIVGQYFYDGDGKRVKKIVPASGETTIFVYDAGGKMVAEYSTVTASAQDAKISYLTNDTLGSPRITTDQNGQVISRRDFMPFGEEIARSGYGSDAVRQKFTSYQRDAETNLDYAKARTFGSSVGRFTSPDPIQISKDHPPNPQKWNLYVYVINNPLRYTDPDGLKPKQVIDIFITYNQDKDSKAEWKKFKSEAKKNGVKIHIYTVENGTATSERFIQSITSKNHSTILMGHSFASSESLAKGVITGAFHGIGIEFKGADSISNKIYTVGDVRLATNTVDGINAKANNIAVFTCDFGNAFDGLGSTNKTNFFSLNNGKDGESPLYSINKAGLAMAEGIIRGESGGQLLRDANKAFTQANKEVGLTTMGTHYDDFVQRRILEPEQEF